MAEDKNKIGTPTEKLLATARERYKRGLEYDEQNRKDALEAIRFRNLEQWDPEIKKARETDPEGARPCPVVDKTGQFLRQVVNDEKQNRPSIKIRPVDDKGDEEVAEVLQGLVRHIEDISGADLAYDTAYEQSVDGGFGYFRILTEYCDSRSFDQEIKIKRIRNRFQVVLDDARQEPDGSDSKWGFIVDKMHRDEFKASFPKADPCDFDGDNAIFGDWIEKDYILVAEYFHFEEKDATICLWKSGAVTVKGEPAPASDFVGDAIIQERQTKLKQLKWKKISAKEVLEERDLPGEYIPIIEVVGEEIDEEGKSHKNGLLKRAMEPQRIHNFASANFIENVGLAPRAQWVAAEGQIEGYENLYKTANRRNISVLPYKPVVAEGNIPVPPPQRAQPAGIAVGWQAVLQNSEHDISSSMGMYAETTLGVGDANSGKQEALQQKRGDTATYHFMDNLARSVRYAGKIVLGWIPTYYDTARVVRIIGEDGKPKMVKLDPNQPESVTEQQAENGAIEKIFNLNVGKYDVTVQTGPGFMTKRQEAAQFLTDITQSAKDPATAQVLTYLAVKNNDWAGAEEAEKMLKKLLPPGVAEPEDGQEEAPMVPTPQGPVPVEQAAQIIAQLTAQVEQVSMQLEKAGDIDKMQADLERAGAQIDSKRKDLEAAQREFALMQQLAEANARLRERGEDLNIKGFDAETRRMAVDHKAMHDSRTHELDKAGLVVDATMTAHGMDQQADQAERERQHSAGMAKEKMGMMEKE